MIGSTEYFQSLIATVVKDGGVGVEDAANMLGCPSFMIESWVSGTDLPEPEECQRLAEKLVALLDEELEFQSLTA